MKTKTFLIIVITLFLLTGITSCDGNNDEDICTFNVDDPINDLEWLKNETSTIDTHSKSVHFYLYQNKKNPQKYFFYEDVQLVGGGQQNSTQVIGYSYIVIFNCKGDIVLSTKYYSSSSIQALNNFYIENTLVKQFWSNNYTLK